VNQGQLALGNKQADQSFTLGQGNLALGQGNLALGNRQADQSFALGQGNLALGNRQADNSFTLGLGNLGVSQGQLALGAQGQQFNQDLSTFNTNQGIFRDNRDTAFNQDLSLANLGLGAAQNFGNQSGNAFINQGAANGNAGMASAGAFAGALGTIGNTAGQAGAFFANPQNQAPRLPGQNVGIPQIPTVRG
jgi:hypothetical protein